MALPEITTTDRVWVFGRWTSLRIVLWTVLAIGITIPLGPRFFRWFFNQNGQIMDYYQEWSSARSVILHQPVYRPTLEFAQRDFGNRLNPKSPWKLGYNVHPPTSVLLALPFGYLPYFRSFLVWSIFTLGLFAISLWLIARFSGYRFGWLSLLPITCGCLLSSPFWHQFQQGQLNPLILFLLTLGWLSLRARKPWSTGFWLGLAAAVKIFPAFLGFYFVIRREWNYLAAMVTSFLVATAVTVGFLGTETYIDYVTLVLPEALEWRSANTNASLAGLWNKLFDPGPRGGHYLPLVHAPIVAKSLILISWLTLLTILAPIWKRARTIEEIDLSFSLAIVAMLLLSPVTWDHYFLLLPLPFLFIWTNLPSHQAYRLAYLLTLAGLAAPAYLWIDTWLPATRNGTGVSPLQTLLLPTFSCYMLCGLLILGVVAAQVPTQGQEEIKTLV